MQFEDEPYVRLYVRDTKTWLRLGFEGQCVLMFLLRKLDKAGVLDGMDDLDSDVALITGVPEAIVAIGMPRLLQWGVVQLVGNRLIMPNYIQAQNAIRTDKARQRDMREKRVAQARLVTPRDGSVTLRDEASREPTPDDGSSHDVTLYCTELCFTGLCRAGDPARPHVASPEPEPDTPEAPAPMPRPANDAGPSPTVPTATPNSQVPSITRITPSGVVRTLTMPSPEPTPSYLAECVIAGVKPEQARSTWTHYWTEGLPERGVERLEGWLVKQAKERQQRHTKVEPRASPRGSNPRASKQPDAGMTGLEGVEIVNGIAVPRLRPAQENPG
ncbi:MAG: hypothetical protein RL685_5162 [Pseudomonadota bacterium]|jgi:hypothetical protein